MRLSKFNDIVVAYNGFSRQEGVAALAVALAKDHDARLHMINIVPELPQQSWTAKEVSAEELHAALIERRQKRLEQLLLPANEQGVKTRATIRSGSPHVEIIREVLALSADLLIVVDEPIERDVRGFGTVTKRLLRECPCPVLAKRDHRKLAHRRILAAVDVETAADEGQLNHRVLDLAGSFAGHSKADLVVFHAWSLWGEQLLRNRSRVKAEELDEILAETKRERRSRMETLVAEAGLEGIEVRTDLVKGDVRSLLHKVVEDDEVDLVVMGTVCRTGVEGYLIGNIAEKLLNELSCSILTVKPEGFKSPVSLMEEG